MPTSRQQERPLQPTSLSLLVLKAEEPARDLRSSYFHFPMAHVWSYIPNPTICRTPLVALASEQNVKRVCMLLCCGSAFVSCLLGCSGIDMPSGQDIFLLGLISHTASTRQCWCPARLGGVGDLRPEQCMVGWQLRPSRHCSGLSDLMHFF